MVLNVTHDNDDNGRPTVVIHCPAFTAVGSGIDFFDALLALAQEIDALKPHFIDEPDEKLAPDALRLKRRMREWFRHEGDFVSVERSEAIEESPNFKPKAADALAARGFERVNRRKP